MGMFGNLNSQGLEETQDRLGGFSALETDGYKGTIKMAYAGKSQGGAQSVDLVIEMEGGKEYRETIYVTNKKGENFFLNKNDTSKKVGLPGYTVMNDLCIMTTDKELHEQDTEDKVVKIYDFDERKEMPKNVPVLTDLLGKQASFAIVKQIENKSKKAANGNYEPTAETRDVNFIDKVFHEPTKLTTVEAKQGLTEGVFYGSWVERNKGNTRDKRTIKDGEAGNSGRPGASNAAPTSGETTGRKSLFGN